MTKEIRTYIGIATAFEGNAQEYKVGERHSFNLFLSQDAGSEESLELAEITISNECWGEIEFKRTGVVSQEKALNLEDPFTSMYKHALENSSALLIYRDIEQ